MWFRVEDGEMDGLVEVELRDHLWEERKVKVQGNFVFMEDRMAVGGVSHHGRQFADPPCGGDGNKRTIMDRCKTEQGKKVQREA